MVLLLVKGVGIWGINIPIGWGFAIVNFVWWIGIGHAGTLISAILLLLHQQWRTSINRFAEAMTLFAVACAGHVSAAAHGPAVAVLLADAVSESDVAVAAISQPAGVGRFRGFDVRDGVFAVLVCGTDSGSGHAARPRQATVRPNHLRSAGDGLARLGGALVALRDRFHLLLAGLATPLVVSVHTVVSFDFSVAQLAGWHTTIFPPYFVAGAIYSGFAMVLTLAIPIRKFYHLEDFITMRHLDNMAKVMLATGLIVAYGYVMETFMAFYSGNQYDQLHDHQPHDRAVRVLLLAADCLQHRDSAMRCGRARCARMSRFCS